MYALVDENDKIISIGADKHTGIASVKIAESVWKEFLIPENLEGKNIKFDPVGVGLIEDTEATNTKSANKIKRHAAMTKIKAYDPATADLPITKQTLQALINLVVTP